MALVMYALVRVADQTKVRESRQTTMLDNGSEAWMPIAYEDRPDVAADEIAEKIEGVDGAVWRKGWTVRQKTQAEKNADKTNKKAADKTELRASIEDVVYALATGGDVSAFVAKYEEIRDR